MNVGTEQIASLMLGDMGVKTTVLGDTVVYSRPGGYVYIMLDTTNKTDTEKEKSNG